MFFKIKKHDIAERMAMIHFLSHRENCEIASGISVSSGVWIHSFVYNSRYKKLQPVTFYFSEN